jgi:hypothetical protein
MSDRPTPRTDAEIATYFSNNDGISLIYLKDHARQLERELAEAQAELEENGLVLQELQNERDAVMEQLETERMRLAAIGVVALADTIKSRDKARDMLPEYRSAALADVERRVDECIKLREQRNRLAEALKACREDSSELLGERSWWKDEDLEDFRERYDETTENIVRANEALDSMGGETNE